MSKPRAMRPDKSPGTTTRLRGSKGYTLPPDLTEKARSRLAMLALFFTVLGCITIALHIAFISLGVTMLRDAYFDWVTAVISLIVYLLVRNPRRTAQQVFRIGLIYEVIACLFSATGVTLTVYKIYGHVPLFSPVLAIIVVFPLIVPSHPRHTLLAAVLAASMDPLSRALLDAMGFVTVEPIEYFFPIMGGAVFTAIAMFGSRVIHGVSVEVARARQLGAYRLETRLGKGGMGEVWRASHRLLVRPAAVKLIKPELSDTGERDRAVKRFQREAQVTATLNSPHTVQLFDFGTTDDGAYYYVMELLDGLDLNALVLQHGPQAPERVAAIMLQICDSLADAHHAGLVHRDIKPANIYLCRKGLRYDFVKVLDFGLVSLKGEFAGEDSLLTVDGFVGTPAYIAPEVASAGSSAADHRVDIYALGCVAYWLLTGHLVFECKSQMATVIAHARDAPLRPSVAYGVDIPAPFEDLVMACLAKQPEQRPRSATELIERIGELGTANHWTPARARGWWENHYAQQPADTGAVVDMDADTGEVDDSTDVALGHTIQRIAAQTRE